jgi:sec-independent protein translocase protein TatC
MSQPEPEDELAGTEQPFVAHLVELRDRLIKAILAVGVAAAVLALWPGPSALYDIRRPRWSRTCPRAPR